MGFNEREQLVLKTVQPLRESERHQAAGDADQAVQRIIGARPRRDQYEKTTISEYPGWFSLAVAVLLFIILAAASVVSVFRVYQSAYNSYLATTNDTAQAAIVGWATFLMAEVTVVIATLAARILFSSKAMQRVFYVVAFMAAAIAVVGNAQITRPVLALSLDSIWQILETFAPPLFVMATALVGERLVADAIRQNYADESAYKAALLDWQEAIDGLRDHPAWRTKYRNALRDLLRQVNGRGRGATERIAFMQAMTAADWSLVVRREENADQWYLEPEAAPNFTQPPTPEALSSSPPSADHRPHPLLPTPANSKEPQP